MLTLLIGYGLSLLAACFLFSDLFWLRDQSFMWHHDAEIPFENTWSIISFFFQGGIQLFDPFDGFNIAYSHLSSGFFTVANVITAFIYMLFYPLYHAPGHAYHDCFSVIFHAVTMCIRTVGGYLLLRRMGLDRLVIVVALVALNTFLSSTMYFGLLTDNLYSYFPLLAYFILNYFEYYRSRDLAAAFFVFVICVANSPFFALGYFYEPVHFLIVSALMMSLLFNRSSMKWRALVQPTLWKRTLAVLGLSALILLPTGMLAKSLSHDYYVANSGINGTEGRIKGIFNSKKYFAPKSETLISPKEMPFKVVDITNDWWEKSWIFWGAGIIGFAMFGLVASRRREKYIFGSVLVLIVLSITALDPSSPLSLAHWINALTNPFAFLLRSYHMPILLMPYVLFVPVALGLQVIHDWAAKGKAVVHWFKRVLLGAGVIALFLTAWDLPVPVKAYAAGVFGLFGCLGVVMWLPLPKRMRMITAGFLMALIVGIDSNALWQYYVKNQYHGRYFCKDDGRHLKPRMFDDFKQDQPLIIEYQNPAIVPWREFVRILPTQTTPAMHSEQNHYGLFYKYVALERFFMEPNIYAPRPLIYKGIFNDMDTIRLLAQNTRSVFLSSEQEGGMVQDLGRHVDRFDFDLNAAVLERRTRFLECQWLLPDNFNPFAATGVFTLDQELLKVILNGETYGPVQGALTAPYQFDVNNIRKGYITVALPLKAETQGKVLQLLYDRSNDMLSVAKNTNDSMRFEFQAGHPGFLKTRLAFDDKWQVNVDGKEVKALKVDKYFLGAQVQEGKHAVELKYWPNAALRWLIALSMVMTFLILGWTIRYAFRSLPIYK